MIDPSVMGEKMEKNKKSRYSENRDFEPSFTLEEENKFREYNNPIHTEEEEVLPGLYQSDIDSWKKQFGAYRDWETDRKSTRLNSSHITRSRMPSSA